MSVTGRLTRLAGRRGPAAGPAGVGADHRGARAFDPLLGATGGGGRVPGGVHDGFGTSAALSGGRTSAC